MTEPEDRASVLTGVRVLLARREAGEPPGGEAELRDEYAVAMELRDWIGDDRRRLDEVELEFDLALGEWILQLPFELADAGLLDEAVEVGRRFAELMNTETLLGDRAEILATSGRADEARQQAEDNLKRFPASVWTVVKCGYVFQECGDIDRAEALYRSGLQLAGDDPYGGIMAVEQLAPLLESTGRGDEAAALRRAGEAWRDALERAEERVPWSGVELFEGRPDEDAASLESPEEGGNGKAHRADPDDVRLFPRMVRRVFAFAARDEFAPVHGEALARWFGGEMEGLALDAALRQLDDESLASAFLEWMMFDLKSGGKTLADRYVERRGSQLDARERALVDRLRGTYPALYEVRDSKPGAGLVLVDVLSGDALDVSACEESEWINPGDLFSARLVELDGALQLTGAVLAYVPEDRQRCTAALETALARAPGASREEKLKEAGDVFPRLGRADA